MGYLPKGLILKAYETLSMLTEDHRQGQTQITSYLRHLLAFDMYYKENRKDCDLDYPENRDSFAENVKKIVNVVGNYYTTNFYSNIKELDDCGVGSNFYSAGVVNNSKQNTQVTYDYPTRGQYPLFKVRSNKLIRDVSYYKNVNAYLKTQDIKSAFIIWVLRDQYINELSALPIKSRLQRMLTEELVDVIMPREEKFNGYVEEFKLSDTLSNVSVSDLLALFGNPNISKTTIQLTNSKYDIYRNAIRVKPFLLLAGISGTGKSRIVRELAFKSCPEYLQDKDGTMPGNYCMIEVKPNWHDSTELLGYYSNMNKSYQFKKFVKFLIKAKMNPEVPFFVCLDEMNLAPVEHYFAEMLSVMETRKHPKMEGTDEVNKDVIKTGAVVESQYFKEWTWTDVNSSTHTKTNMSDMDWYRAFFDVAKDSEEEAQISKYQYERTLQKEGLTLPDNVIIIGTVNMDDTTHQFSRKVIDRAMTIEMNGGKLSNMFGGSKNLEYLPKEEQKKWQKSFQQLYVNADEVLEAHPNEAEDIIEKVPAKLDNINKALKGTPFEVSYRVLNELTIMVGVLLDSKKEGENIDDIINQALDYILLMKILPRIEGDSDMFNLSREFKQENHVEYNNRLEWLMALAPEIKTKEHEDDDYRQTAREKIKEMMERLKNQEFTRFWP
ncbi:hypothetical protein SAMN04487901_105106 [Prevotella communis]|uniref:ATPase dynein-related AAA domain-containing protein n=1 Tax=Prevotella communis TaxID=2913614 RepID=A0A1G7V6E3_9BACT|nr:hypothetical protein SAMN04487901_105106 [Prevotella communis]